MIENSVNENTARASFDEVYKRYWSKLYASAYNLLRDREACKDIVQEVFIDYWNKRNTAQIRDTYPYLKQSVRYNTLKHLYAAQKQVRTEFFDELEDLLFKDDALISMQYVKDLELIAQNEIENLPARCREVYVLRREYNLSIAEISRQLNISSKTVEVQITRALKKLRLRLKEILMFFF